MSNEAANEPVEVTFYLHADNHEKLWTAAAHEGDTFTDTLNRAVAFYATVMQAKRRQVIHWYDKNGIRRAVRVVR